MSTKVFLTATSLSNWTVPADWNNSSNTIECIGAGSNGGTYTGGIGSTGGAGGAYAKIVNFNVANSTLTVQYQCGAAGTNGGNSFFNGTSLGSSSVGAQGGQGATGGAASSSVGTTKYSGGNGAVVTDGSGNGGGGGGAAGLNGAGGNSSGSSGGTGDNGTTAAGANGTEWQTSPAYGSGGGGVSTIGNTPTGGGTYGAGGGGGNNARTSGSAGSQGLIVITYTPVTDPGTRYWVGGTANWDASTTANWSYNSGSWTGASVPGSSSNVYFDANSGSGTATITATANTLSLNLTGYTGTLAGSSALNIYGGFTGGTTATLSYSGALAFVATTTGFNISTGSLTLPSSTFNGVGGGWTFTSNNSFTAITLTTGSLNLGSYTVTLTGTGLVWSATSSAQTFLVPGTSTIKITNTSFSDKTFAGGSYTYHNLYITGSGTGVYTISGSNIFADFKVDTPPHTVKFTAGSRTGVSTFTVNGTAGNLMTLQSTASGSPWYIYSTSGNVVQCDYLSLQDSIAL